MDIKNKRSKWIQKKGFFKKEKVYYSNSIVDRSCARSVLYFPNPSLDKADLCGALMAGFLLGLSNPIGSSHQKCKGGRREKSE